MERFSDICERTGNDLTLFVGGELDPAPRAELERHLESCSRCRAAERAARSAHRSLLRGLGEHTGPGLDLWPAIRAQLAHEGRLQAPRSATISAFPGAPLRSDSDRSASQPASVQRAGFRFGWVIAVAAGILLTVWIVHSSSQGSTGSPFAPEGNGSAEFVADRVLPGVRDPIAATPVSDGGLRRLAPDERAFADTAVLLGSEERAPYSIVPVPQDRGAEAASLRRVNLRR